MPCPDENTAAELAAGLLPAGAAAELEHHAAECADCRRMFAALAIEDAPPSGVTGPVRRGVAVGRYVVGDLLGAGGMGAVYSAYDPELERTVALKLLRPRLDRAGDAERLLREARTMAQLAHPNVVRVYDAGRHGEEVFFAMERVEGETLRAWMADRPRPWREILGVFLQAGRGLAAAHAIGVVHRDFKPDNVLVGDDGEARVGDFGVAQASPRAEQDGAPEAVERAGTPAYMAPEQLAGDTADEAGDQYSFCVALHEALFGHRPRAGGSGPGVTARSSGRVPKRVRRALHRGLSLDPRDRYRSIDALCADLSRALRARRAAVAVAVAIAAIGAVGGATLVVGRTPDPCAQARRALDDVWSTAHREEIRAAPMRAGAGGDVAIRALTARIDRYAARWAKASEAVCAERSSQQRQAPPMLALKRSCLDQRLAALDELVSRLAGGDPGTLARGRSAVASLEDPDECRSARASFELLARQPPRETKASQAIRARLARARVLLDLGKIATARAWADEAAVEAARIGRRPLEAEALLLLGILESQDGAPMRGEETLRDAVTAADAGNRPDLAVEAWTRLAVATIPRDAAMARQRLEHAEALIDRLDGHPRLEGDLARARGKLLDYERRFDEARAAYRRALEIARGQESAIRVARIESDLGGLSDVSGRRDQARRHHERAVAIAEERLGSQHPELASYLLRLGQSLAASGAGAEAEAHLQRALSIWERALGSGHPATALARRSLAGLLAERGRIEEATALVKRAAQELEEALGQHAEVAVARARLGWLLLEGGDPGAAETAFAQAVGIWERISADPIMEGDALAGLGRAMLEQGRAREAIDPLERALERLPQTGPGRGRAAIARLALARALWQGGGDRARARELAAESAGVEMDAPADQSAIEVAFARWNALVRAADRRRRARD